MFHLLQEIANIPVLSYDPLPPDDSVISYSRPERFVMYELLCIHYLAVELPATIGSAVSRVLSFERAKI